MSQLHNLDEGVSESFNFVVKGHEYSFRHLNTEEIEQVQKLEKTDEKTREFLYQFITKVKPESPDFSEVAKQMIAPQWKKFQAMVKAEMGG